VQCGSIVGSRRARWNGSREEWVVRRVGDTEGSAGIWPSLRWLFWTDGAGAGHRTRSSGALQLWLATRVLGSRLSLVLQLLTLILASKSNVLPIRCIQLVLKSSNFQRH